MKTATEEIGTLAAKAGCLSHVLCVFSNGLLCFKEPEGVPTVCLFYRQENPCTNVACTGHGSLDVNRVLAELCRETGGGQSDFSKGLGIGNEEGLAQSSKGGLWRPSEKVSLPGDIEARLPMQTFSVMIEIKQDPLGSKGELS